MNQIENNAAAQVDHLALCPYCGGPGQDDFIVDVSYVIECYWCGARTDSQGSEAAAVAAWNRRADGLSDDDYAAIVKRYEDAGDSQNADIIRRQWAAARAGAPTSYGLPARIDGIDTARLNAVLASAGATMANYMHEALERIASSPAFLAAVSNLHADLKARGFIPTRDETQAAGGAEPRRGFEGLPVERRAKAARALADMRFDPVLALAADKDKLLTIIAAAYQVAGAHDAPAHILDVLADPESATADQVDAMMPYQPDQRQAQADQLMREALSAVSWLYRRLPRGFGRQQHIDVVIERLARETGTGIDELIERAEAEGKGHG